MNCTLRIIFFAILIAGVANTSQARERYNFNPGWLLKVGDFKDVEKSSFNDSDWKKISLPHAFNEDEAFKVSIAQMTDTVAWWKSHATLTPLAKQDLPTFGYNMIALLKSWCWGSILFYPFKISRFS